MVENVPVSDGSVDLLQSYILRFAQCDPVLAIIDAASYLFPEVLSVDTFSLL